MKAVVCVKQVRTLGDEVEFTADNQDVDQDYVELAVNEWDTYAVEEALRVKEALGEGEVVVVTLGDDESEAALRRCLAMGADRAIRVEHAGRFHRRSSDRRPTLWRRRWRPSHPISSSPECSRATRCKQRPAPCSRSCSTSHG